MPRGTKPACTSTRAKAVFCYTNLQIADSVEGRGAKPCKIFIAGNELTISHRPGGTKLHGVWGAPHNLENLPFCKAKRQCNVFFQSSLLDPERFEQLPLLKLITIKFSHGRPLIPPPKHVEITSLLGIVHILCQQIFGTFEPPPPPLSASVRKRNPPVLTSEFRHPPLLSKINTFTLINVQNAMSSRKSAYQ